MRFGRKSPVDASPEEAVEESADKPSALDQGLVEGPYDLGEIDFDDTDQNRINLGSLIITGRPEVELRLQVDETGGNVAAALLVTEDGAAELRAFASPRNGSIWEDVRRSIAADATRQGGTATEVDGPWGTELKVMIMGRDDQGRALTQESRIAGITGPRWLLRVAFYGAPAVSPIPPTSSSKRSER